MSCSEAEESSLLNRSFRFFIFSSKVEKERTSELWEGVGVLTSGMPLRPAFREGRSVRVEEGGRKGERREGERKGQRECKN